MTQVVDCTGCGATGQVVVPTPEIDHQGKPAIVHVIITCIVCHGSGSVEIPG